MVVWWGEPCFPTSPSLPEAGKQNVNILFSLFYNFTLYLLVFRERGREEKRERHTDVREKHWLVTSGMPPTGELVHNPSLCLWLGIEPANFWSKVGFNPLSHTHQGKTKYHYLKDRNKSWVSFVTFQKYSMWWCSSESGSFSQTCLHFPNHLRVSCLKVGAFRKYGTRGTPTLVQVKGEFTITTMFKG